MRLQTTFHVITLFPEALAPYLDASIIGRARKEGKIHVVLYNPRDFVLPVRGEHSEKEQTSYKRVDKRPYGGGPGMVLQAAPILAAVEKARGRKKNVAIIFFSAGGKQFTNGYAKILAQKKQHIILIAGHYEGVDARVQKILKAEEISIGPYVLTGGELPALVVIDAVSRQIPGVLGKRESLEEERVASSDVYTRPEVLIHKGKRYRVPKVLLFGHHKKIEEWKKKH